MTRRLMLMGTLAAVLLMTAPAMGHDDYRVIGTIVKRTAKKIDVKQSKDDKVLSIAFDDTTTFTRDKKAVSADELKTGVSVVVDARGDSEADLLALDVRIVPAPATR